LVWKELNYGQMNEKEKQMLVSEVNLLREFRHPHIVRYHDRIIDRDSTTIFIVMEYCEGGDLAALIRRQKREKFVFVLSLFDWLRQHLDEKFVWRIFAQLLTAIQVRIARVH
jgi:serine/threonine protein kinase